MKRLLTFLFLFFAMTASGEESVDPGGYKSAKWGMTKEEIKAAFPEEKFYKKSLYAGWYDSISYLGKLTERNYEILFSFNKENKLIAVCLFPEPSGPPADFFSPILQDFPILLSNLTSKYGEPTNIANVDKSIFVNNLIGLQNGTAKIEYQWVLETTVIYLRIERDMREPVNVTQMTIFQQPPGPGGVKGPIVHYMPILEYRSRKSMDLPTPSQNIQNDL